MSNELDQLSTDLRKIISEQNRHLRDAVNESADDIRQKGVQRIAGTINLPRSYIEDRLFVSRRATQRTLEAAIHGLDRPVLLARFDAKQKYTTGKTVPQKNAGVGVRVKASGSEKHMRSAFLLVLKNGALGLATREGEGRSNYRVRHGPSVGQLWRAYINDNDDALDDVAERFMKRLAAYD